MKQKLDEDAGNADGAFGERQPKRSPGGTRSWRSGDLSPNESLRCGEMRN